MRKSSIIAVIVGATLIFGMTGCSNYDTVDNVEYKKPNIDFNIIDTDNSGDIGNDTASESQVLGNFEATTLDGNTVDQEILKDYTLTMVNVWATYCGPCLNEMPELGELSEELKDSGIQIIGIVCDCTDYDFEPLDDVIDTAKNIVAETGASYIHLIPNKDLLDILSMSGLVPTTFFVDKDGNLVGEIYTGAKTKDDWRSIIDSTIGLVEK